jgi:hypothetical protein
MIETIDGVAWTHPLVKYYLSALLIAWPAMVICARFGVTRLSALCLGLPYIGFVALCVWLAFAARAPRVTEAGDVV